MFDLQETNGKAEREIVERLFEHLADESLFSSPFKNAELYVFVSFFNIFSYPEGRRDKDLVILSSLSATNTDLCFWRILLRFKSPNSSGAFTTVGLHDMDVDTECATIINSINSLSTPQNNPKAIKRRLHRAFDNFVAEYKEMEKTIDKTVHL